MAKFEKQSRLIPRPISERPAEKPADAYSTTALQRALECDEETLTELLAAHPPLSESYEDCYGEYTTDAGTTTLYYTPTYLGKLRIVLATRDNTKFMPWSNPKIRERLVDRSVFTKTDLARQLDQSSHGLDRLMKKIPPYPDEIDQSNSSTPRYAARYLTRLILATIYGIEFKSPTPEHERRKTQLLTQLQQWSQALESVFEYKTQQHRLPAAMTTIHKRALAARTAIQDLRSYILSCKATADLETDFVTDPIGRLAGTIPDIMADFQTHTKKKTRDPVDPNLLAPQTALETAREYIDTARRLCSTIQDLQPETDPTIARLKQEARDLMAYVRGASSALEHERVDTATVDAIDALLEHIVILQQAYQAYQRA
jgi:hypothetical protein